MSETAIILFLYTTNSLGGQKHLILHSHSIGKAGNLSKIKPLLKRCLCIANSIFSKLLIKKDLRKFLISFAQ